MISNFKYKCRKCGEIVTLHQYLENEPDKPIEWRRAFDKIRRAMGRLGDAERYATPPLMELHSCDKNSEGIADLIGYDVEE